MLPPSTRFPTGARGPQAPRRRRRHRVPGSPADIPVILLLLLAPILGLVLLAGVRLYVAGPLMVASFFAVAFLVGRNGFRREAPPWKIPPGLVPLALFGVYLVLLIPRAAVPHEAMVEGLKFAGYLAAYWAWTEVSSVRGRWRYLLAIPLVLGTFICWYALIQHAHGSRMVLWMERPEQYEMRASGTHVCPNHLAQVLAMLMVLGLTPALTKSAGLPLRILGLYVMALATPVLLLTGSRSGWLGTVAGLGTMLLLLAARRGFRRLAVILPLFVLIVGGAIAALWYTSPIFKERVTLAFEHDVRPLLWKDTLPVIADEPVFGQGGGSFRWVFPGYQAAFTKGDRYARYAHNEYLHFSADYGLVGAGLLVLALAVFVARYLRAFFRAREDRTVGLTAGLLGCMAAVAVHSFFDFNLHIFANVHLLAMVSGVVAGTLYGSGDFRPVPVPKAVTRTAALLALLALAGVAVMTTLATVSYTRARQAETARKKLDLDRALRLADQAVRFDPGYWQGHLERAHVLKSRGFWDVDPEASEQFAHDAVSAYEQVLALNPHENYARLELSRTYGDLLGDNERALHLLEETIERAPANAQIRAELGLHFRRVGRDREALDVFLAARKLDPNDKMVKLNIRSLERKLKGGSE